MKKKSQIDSLTKKLKLYKVLWGHIDPRTQSEYDQLLMSTFLQIIYPHTHQEMKRRGRTDADLQEYLELVQLSYLQVREKGLDAIEDWIDVLSGGEKQRIAMARLFYHSPQFAILDECTSAVSVDVEGSMYEYCRKVGITLFTVSHRKSLWKHHDYYLQFDGHGAYDYAPIDGSEQQFGS